MILKIYLCRLSFLLFIRFISNCGTSGACSFFIFIASLTMNKILIAKFFQVQSFQSINKLIFR